MLRIFVLSALMTLNIGNVLASAALRGAIVSIEQYESVGKSRFGLLTRDDIRILIHETVERERLRLSFDLALAECNLRRALELAALEPEDLRSEKLAQIRIRGEEKVREYGTLYRLLRGSSREIDDDYSISATAQYAKACEIKGAFPEGDPIRTHLDAVWAEVSAIPAPVVSTEVALAEHRELMGRLAEEE